MNPGDPASVELSSETLRRLETLFSSETQDVAALLLREECGNNLPLLRDADGNAVERIRIAALKVSGGDLAKLEQAVDLAKTDWRDLLVAAGFEHDVQAHLKWLPQSPQPG